MTRIQRRKEKKTGAGVRWAILLSQYWEMRFQKSHISHHRFISAFPDPLIRSISSSRPKTRTARCSFNCSPTHPPPKKIHPSENCKEVRLNCPLLLSTSTHKSNIQKDKKKKVFSSYRRRRRLTHALRGRRFGCAYVTNIVGGRRKMTGRGEKMGFRRTSFTLASNLWAYKKSFFLLLLGSVHKKVAA